MLSYMGIDTAYLLLYVDDIVLTASFETLLRQVIGMFLPRHKYTIEILERAHMVNFNSSRTPVDTESKLRDDCDPASDLPLYQILAGTLDYQLQLFSSSTIDLVAYLALDSAGCPTTRRSTSGYYIFLGNNLLSWSSKRQPTLSHSSVEVEYRGVANAVTETCWLKNLLRELHTPVYSAMLVYCDNLSAVYLSSNPV
nr:ribonuclease H-like domain-containing protein [Tanacetum cinerariifolium]